MSQQSSPSAPRDDRPQGDPWNAFGYVVAGVGFYGFLGWLADRWLDTSFLVAIGILVGATLGIYLTFVRFNRSTAPRAQHDEQPDPQAGQPQQHGEQNPQKHPEKHPEKHADEQDE